MWYCIIPQNTAFIFGYFVVAKPSLRYLAAHGYSTNTSSEIFEIDVLNCETAKPGGLCHSGLGELNGISLQLVGLIVEIDGYS